MKKALLLFTFLFALAAFSFAQPGPASAPRYYGKKSSDPATCAEGSWYYNTTSHAFKYCSATNTWSALGGGGGITVGTTTSNGTANTVLKTNGSSAVADATGVTHPANGQLNFNPGSSTFAIDVDRTSNTGDQSGVRIVPGDSSNLAANRALFITNAAEDRGVVMGYDGSNTFATSADSSSYRVATTGGVGGREIRMQPGAVDRMILPVKKTLTNNTTTDIYDIALPTLTGTGGVIKCTVFAANATDAQARSQIVRYSGVNKGGVYTTEIVVVSEAVSASTGTLTGTWTINTGTNKITLRFNGNSSITPTTLWVQVTIESFSDQAITLL